MQLTQEQDRAIQSVRRWLSSKNQPVFTLAGYAGTGKTTITRLLTEDLKGRVCYAAFTGKAAHVMRRNGCDGATTIHKLIYVPRDKSQQELRRLEALLVEQEPESPKAVELRAKIEAERRVLAQPSFTLNEASDLKNAKLVVIDEASMVDGRTAQDLRSFDVPLLAIGDPGQLPPVKGRSFFSMDKPDAILTKVHRQAADSPVIRMATDIREGKALSYGDLGDSRVVDRNDERLRDDALKADQLIVGLRASRTTYNERMRQLLNRTGEIDKGDRLVCLRNDHEAGFMNGSLWQVSDYSIEPSLAHMYLSLDSLDDDRPRTECSAYREPLASGEAVWNRDETQSFTYGYALTCHKAQGSAWDDVVVFDESGSFRENAQRWLYTAVTRASRRVTVVR